MHDIKPSKNERLFLTQHRRRSIASAALPLPALRHHNVSVELCHRAEEASTFNRRPLSTPSTPHG